MTWGLVLSGGAAHGIANAGVLDVLHDEGLRPDCIAGSSMGAIVGALSALGHPPASLRTLTDSLSLWKVARLSSRPLHRGLHGGILRQNLEEYLEKMIGGARIADCKIPFVCAAGRIVKPIEWHRIIQDGFSDYLQHCFEYHVFPPQTRLTDALLATSAIPVLFSPMRIGNDEFIDLVSFGALPARTLRRTMHPDRIVATDTAPRYERLRRFLPGGWRTFIEDGNASIEEDIACCDVVIKPTLTGSPFAFHRAAAFYDAGAAAARKRLAAIRAAIGEA